VVSVTRDDHLLRRFVLRSLIGTAGLVVALVLLAILSFAGIFLWQMSSDHVPVLRAAATSPDGRVQALLQSDDQRIHEDYVIRLKPADGKAVDVAWFGALQRNADADGADLVWVNNNTLEIRYLSAGQFMLSQSRIVLEGALRSIRLADGWIANGPQPGQVTLDKDTLPLPPPCPTFSLLCR
jgi:hypothetical protein